MPVLEVIEQICVMSVIVIISQLQWMVKFIWRIFIDQNIYSGSVWLNEFG